MNELKEMNVMVEQKNGSIEFKNYDAICEQLTAQMDVYKNLDFKEEDKPVAKKDLATLRKIKKAIDDRRKQVKGSFMTPYTEFEIKVKDLLSIIDEPIRMIDSKVSEFEKNRIAEKTKHVNELFCETVADMDEYISFLKCSKPEWLNASYKDAGIVSDIQEVMFSVKRDLEAIRSFDTDCTEKAIERYLSNYDLSAAMQYINTYEAGKKAAEEKQKEQEKEQAVKEAVAINNQVPDQTPEEVAKNSFTDTASTPVEDTHNIIRILHEEDINNVICYLLNMEIEFERL